MLSKSRGLGCFSDLWLKAGVGRVSRGTGGVSRIGGVAGLSFFCFSRSLFLSCRSLAMVEPAVVRVAAQASL